jgi:lysophospholipase L1-like esterase
MDRQMMKIESRLVIACCLALLGFSSIRAATTVVIVGDSTVATYEKTLPFRGWGQMLQAWAKPGVEVRNHAVSGTSSKSFRDLGLWTKALQDKPAYVFIQFGHNDIGSAPDRHSDPDTTYRQNLRQYIDETRAAGATPILVTPPVRRVYKDGKLVHEHLLPYVEAMTALGSEMHVPVIPLYDDSFAYYATLSLEEAQKKVSPKEGDLVHFNEVGASLLAADLLGQLSKVEPDAAALFSLPATAKPVQSTDAK